MSQYYYPEVFRINDLAAALVERGHRISVLTGQPNYPSGQIFSGYSNRTRWRDRHANVDIYRVPILARRAGRGRHLILNYLSFIASASVLGLIRLPKTDVCLIWSTTPITAALPAILYSWIRGIPLVIWVQDLWPETFFAVTKSKNRVLRYAVTQLVRFIYRNCEQIWIQSPAFSESIVEHGGVDRQIHYVPNWAEDFYDRSHSQSSDSQVVGPLDAQGKFTIIFAGNIGRAQSIMTILDAAERLRAEPVTWSFIGDGTLKSWLSDELTRRGLEASVFLLPRVPAIEMPKYFRGASALLLSLANEPVFGMTIPSKLQSYLASGRPILVSASGEVARLVRESGAGLASTAGDSIGLVNNVKTLLSLTLAERALMGQRGYEYFHHHFRRDKLIARAESLLTATALKEKKL